MDEKIFVITILVLNREKAYSKVNEILHNYSSNIMLRVGYPVENEGIAIIFVVFKGNTDQLGAFTGKLGSIKSVKVKSILVK